MPEQHRRRSAKPQYSGNHQRSWLWGHHAVREALQSGTWPILEIYISSECQKQLKPLLDQQALRGTRIEVVSSARLEELVRNPEHQGLVARMGHYPYRRFDELASEIDGWSASPTTPLLLVCDRIQDAFNFGAILRCCEGAQVSAVFVGESHQAPVTPHVARSSAGAVHHLPIVQCPDLIEAASRIRGMGFQLIAADANGGTTLWNAALQSKTAVIIGSEAFGIAPDLLNLCDRRVTIPMQGRVQSLNAAVACGILLYEIRRQQITPRT